MGLGMRRFLSASSLIGQLLTAGAKKSVLSPVNPDQPNTGTTLRFDPELRAYLEAVRAEVGLPTLAAVVTMLLSGIMRASQAEVRGGDLSHEAEIMTERVHYLLAAHKVDVITAGKMLAPFGVKGTDLRDRDKLLDLLVKEPEILTFLAKTFLLGHEWLLGRSDRPGHDVRRWYKSPRNACERALELLKAWRSPHMIFVCAASADLDAAYTQGDAITAEHMTLLISSSLPDTPITVVEQWESARWNDRVLRRQLKAIMQWAVKVGSLEGVKSIGYRLPDNVYRALLSERILPIEALNAEAKNIWFPDEYIDVYQSSKEKDDVHRVQSVFESFELGNVVLYPHRHRAAQTDNQEPVNGSGN